MKELCNEIFVQSRDVREFFNRSIPVISSLDQEAFLPSANAWSSIPVAPPDSKLSLIEGLHPYLSTNYRPLPIRTLPPYRSNPSRNLPRPRKLQLSHGLRNLQYPRLQKSNTHRHRPRRDLPPWERNPAMGTGCRVQGVGETR